MALRWMSVGTGIRGRSRALVIGSTMATEYITITAHLVAALIAGGAIGLERSFHGRPAGFRTHTLLCVASSLLMLVTLYQWQWLPGIPMDTVKTDPTRMAQGIMTGIGFLGAGVIYKEGVSIHGLTTAASVWMTAAIGILDECLHGFRMEIVNDALVTCPQKAPHHVGSHPAQSDPAEFHVVFLSCARPPRAHGAGLRCWPTLRSTRGPRCSRPRPGQRIECSPQIRQRESTSPS